MDRNSRYKEDLIDLMLGRRVAIKYISGPDVTDENVDRVVEQGQILEGSIEARTATFYLRAYSNFGIEVNRKVEPGDEIFIPWGAVLAIWGPSRESLEREARRDTTESQPVQTGESSTPRDHQEIMTLLINARTPSEVIYARAAADRWLSTHPGDGDVRLAREHLRAAYPDEALEEGSPT